MKESFIHHIDPQKFLRQEGIHGALQILRVLREAGFESYLAGGCVRDIFLGRKPKDFDVATAASPDRVHRLFPKTISVGEEFGTVGVLVEEQLFQVTTFRIDGKYVDGRHPEEGRFGGAREDALRRDFTINGLFADPEQGKVLDYVEGLDDLQKKRIRAIGDPCLRFEEDALRLLRAARFSLQLDFPIEAATHSAIQKLAPNLHRISAERIREELIQILCSGKPAEGIEKLSELRLLQEILPEVEAMKGVEQSPQFHPEGDVYVHTLLALSKLDSKELIVVLGVLLHDVAKPRTFERGPDRIRFYGHDQLGAEMAEEILRRLVFSNEQRQRVCALVRDHLKIAALPQMREGKRRRFLNREDIEDHLELHRVDCLASHGKLDIYDFCRQELRLMGQAKPKMSKVLDGNDLKAMGYAPGPIFKEILTRIEEEQWEGTLQNREEAALWVKKQYPRTPQ